MTNRVSGGRGRTRTATLSLGLLAAATFGACTSRTEDTDIVEQSLVDAFASAEIRKPVERIVFGTASAHANLVRGWSHDESFGDGGGPFVWSIGDSSVLEFRVAAEGPLRLVLACFPFEDARLPNPTMDVVLNGREIRTVPLQRGLHEYDVDCSSDAVRVGTNRLEFHYSQSTSPASVRPGSTDARALAVGWSEIRFGAPALCVAADPTVNDRTIRIPSGVEVRFFSEIPTAASLVIDDVSTAPSTDASLSCRVVSSRGSVQASETRHGSVELDLSEEAGDVVAISFEARGVDPAGWVSIRRPMIRARESSSGPVVSKRASVRTIGTPPNLLLYVIDTLRADRIGCYGNPNAWTPHIDAFARDSWQFRDGAAQSSWTRTSMASVLTGLHPKTHGVQDRGDALPSELTTLAERLSDVGYECGAFIGNANVASGLGFAQGFTTFRYFSDRAFASDTLGRAAAEWLPQNAPFFLWLHAIDPHSPYAPPPNLRNRFLRDSNSETDGSVEQLKAFAAGRRTPPPGAATTLLALYDGEVSRNDQSFGWFVRELRSRGLLDVTNVVLLSDHGEEFREHGGWEHGRTLFREVVHVPFLIRLPVARGGGAIRERAEHIDLVPTALDLAGLPCPDLGGVSLARQDDSWSAPRRRPTLQSVDLDGRAVSAITWRHWKLIRSTGEERSTRLFDREQDPGERRDVRDDQPVIAGYLARLLDEEESRLEQPVSRAKAELDAEALEQLRALGYVQ